MVNKGIYLDHAATTEIDDTVLKEMMPYLTNKFGNPSSLYSIGRENKQAIDTARQQVADVLNCSKKEIFFTSGGSESDNLAIKGIAYANRKKGNHIITSKIEHSAVLNTCKMLEKNGFEVTYVNVDSSGKVVLNELQNSIKPTTILISIMFANNEVGTVQDIESIGSIAKKNNIYFHTDAVQAIGNIRIDLQRLNIDALSMSAHKFYGPKGVGALYVRNGIMFDSIINGGHQESGKRAGTENVAGIVGLGKAIELAYSNFDKYNQYLLGLRNEYIKNIETKIPNSFLNGDRINRLPGNANFSFEGVKGEDIVLMLDMEGICTSSGSACSSGNSNPSHVLSAMGKSKEIALGAVRVTFGKDNTKSDVEKIVDKMVEIVNKLRESKSNIKDISPSINLI